MAGERLRIYRCAGAETLRHREMPALPDIRERPVRRQIGSDERFWLFIIALIGIGLTVKKLQCRHCPFLCPSPRSE